MLEIVKTKMEAEGPLIPSLGESLTWPALEPDGHVKEAIRAHASEEQTAATAQRRRPEEVCGFVIRRGRKQAVMRCRNSARHPDLGFVADPGEAEDAGDVLLCYHSHPYLSPEPSPADKTTAEKHGVPMLILSWPVEAWALYAPCGWRAELLGRPFVHGVLDCYTLVRDYYAEKLNIALPDFTREDEWWYKGGNLYLDNFDEAGFVRVHDELQPHDVLLIIQGHPPPLVPNHAAVYLGDGMIMHHVQERLSCVQPYTHNYGYYAKMTYARIRHRSLC
jgi:cell wall-associated NlpC family hydrolase